MIIQVYKYNIQTNKCKYYPFRQVTRYISNINVELLYRFIKDRNIQPVHIYKNLHLDETRETFRNETNKLSGIYLIFNCVTGDSYIGSVSTNRFYARFSNHLLYFKGSKVLKHAVKKYKMPNFAFLILEILPDIVNKENNKMLLDMEDFYLNSLFPNYNILTEAGFSFGYKHSEVTRLKMKTNYSVERRILAGNIYKNKTLSIESKEKIREKIINRGKISFSDNTLLNMKKDLKL